MAVLGSCALAARPNAADIIPPLDRIETDRPRLLIRPGPSPLAISLKELRAASRSGEYQTFLDQLRREESPSAQAMVWLLTGENAAADKAIAVMGAYRFQEGRDTFHTHATLTRFGLAYDWLHGYEGFTPAVKADIRARVNPLAHHGMQVANDHIFHNYIWMSAGGVAMWAMATAGEDDEADRVFNLVRDRFNSGLFPAWKYLDGLPSEPMGYWALYVFTPGMLTVLAAQSAFEADLVATIRDTDGDWLNRHFDNLIQSTLPNMRYISWGDLQGGPNGGVTYEMAGVMDALTWATKSSQGLYFSDWLAKKRGPRRFYGDTAIFFMLYTARLKSLGLQPAEPPLSFFAGAGHGGHFVARSDWTDEGAVVALTCTDHFGDHHHYDQGSFAIWRQGPLAVDPPVYKKVRGPQQPTDVHNTLLLGGQAQRPCRGQWFKTVEDFRKNLDAGRRLETGNTLFHHDAGAWAAVAVEFAQAYAPGLAQSCVRQLLFVRPGKIVIVDRIVPSSQDSPLEVQWLLQTPEPPVAEGSSILATNDKSWLLCRPLTPSTSGPTVEPTNVNTHRIRYRYEAKGPIRLVHFIEVGDGQRPKAPAEVTVQEKGETIEIQVEDTTYAFSAKPSFAISKTSQR